MFERARASGEIAALRSEVERLRAFVETRVRAQENMMRAMTVESSARAAEALEGRIRLAEGVAIAFAEQGLQQHEAALRAFGRRVAALSRRDDPSWREEQTSPREEQSSSREEQSSSREHDAPTPDVAAAPPAALNYVFGANPAAWPDCRPIALPRDGGDWSLTDLAHLPILPGGAAKLVASHIVEHAPEPALAGELLPRWRDCLAPGGELVVSTLDGPGLAAQWARACEDFTQFRSLFGVAGARAPLRALYDRERLRGLLGAAGFAHVEDASAPDARAICVVARRRA